VVSFPLAFPPISYTNERKLDHRQFRPLITRVSGFTLSYDAEAKLRYEWRLVSQYVLVSGPLWDLRPDINSVWKLLSCVCAAPSLTRGRVCVLSVTVSGNCPLSSYFFFLMMRSQSVSMSWCWAHFVDVWPDISSFSSLWVWNLLSCVCGAPSLTRGRVCPLSVCTFTIYMFVSLL
jgi:hypothetical protein